MSETLCTRVLLVQRLWRKFEAHIDEALWRLVVVSSLCAALDEFECENMFLSIFRVNLAFFAPRPIHLWNSDIAYMFEMTRAASEPPASQSGIGPVGVACRAEYADRDIADITGRVTVPATVRAQPAPLGPCARRAAQIDDTTRVLVEPTTALPVALSRDKGPPAEHVMRQCAQYRRMLMDYELCYVSSPKFDVRQLAMRVQQALRHGALGTCYARTSAFVVRMHGELASRCYGFVPLYWRDDSLVECECATPVLHAALASPLSPRYRLYPIGAAIDGQSPARVPVPVPAARCRIVKRCADQAMTATGPSCLARRVAKRARHAARAAASK